MMDLLKNFKKLTKFIQDVANDPAIPERDKKVLLVLTALILSPFDIIPDWIPVIGVLDDVILIAIVLDYFFNVLDEDVLLRHYPWDLRSFIRLRRAVSLISWVTPQTIKTRIWKYQPDVYR